MPLILHRSSDAALLAAEASRLLAEPIDNPFAIDRVAAHSGGLEQWLKMQIAKANGICGALRFPTPEALVAELATEVLGGAVESTWTTEALLWAMLAELPLLLNTACFQPVCAYLHADGPAEYSLRLVTLCQRLARVFQTYGAYRPERVRAWGTPSPTEPWEAPLWRALEHRIGATHLTAWFDRLQGKTLAPTAARSMLFTVTTLPPLALQMLASMAGDRPIHLFALHPSPTAWANGAPQHPLLRSMGSLANAFRDVAVDTPGIVHHLIERAPPPRDTLLHALQADLHQDTQRPFDPDPTDQSLRIHACTSPLRQVQVLRDSLLKLLDDPSLEPRDIVVMCPDVETFAPLIEAVFRDGSPRWEQADEHPGGFPALPYRLADRGVRFQNLAAEALMGMLELLDTRLEAPEVINLLALEPVRERFGVQVDELQTVRRWLDDAGARWGADVDHRVREDLPPDDRFTWRFAIDRLLLGQALASPDVLVLGHTPAGDLESMDDRRLLGGLVHFLETLLEQVDTLRDPRTPTQWFQAVHHALDLLLSDTSERAWQKHQVFSILHHLAEQASSLQDTIDLRTLRALLADRLHRREPGQGFLGGSITVCQLVPLRSIPFQVVCLLGIDAATFPRIQTRPGFDRMANNPLPGDRDAQVDDRALFLEALISARRQVILTCTERSERSGRSIPYAVPVAELLETVQAMSGASIVVSHPLQPWSPNAFEGEATGVDRRLARAAHAWSRGRTAPVRPTGRFAAPIPPNTQPPTSITLKQLIRFWRDPPTAFVRERLMVSFFEEEAELTALLPHALDGLERWKLRDQILAASQGGHDLDALSERLLRGASLPLGVPGHDILATHRSATEQLLGAGPTGALQPPIDVAIYSLIRITGRIGGIYPDGRWVLQAGKVKDKHLLELWIHHLVLHASGWSGTSTLVGLEPKGPRGKIFLPLDQPGIDGQILDVDATLSALCEGRRLGLDQPLLFHPEHSFALAKSHPPSTLLRKGTLPSSPDPERADRMLLAAYPLLAGYHPQGPVCAWSLAKRVWWPALPFLEDVTP